MITDRVIDSRISPATSFDVVVVASSAGGVHALSTLVSGLPRAFPAAIVVAQHVAPHKKSYMPEILSRRTDLSVMHARNNQKIRRGDILIAPPDCNMTISSRKTIVIEKTDAPKFAKPSADLLFKSAAEVYENRVIAVVLTGTGTDGSKGIEFIKESGGLVIIESINSAEFAGMPQAASRTGHVDFELPLADIANALVGLVTEGKLDEKAGRA